TTHIYCCPIHNDPHILLHHKTRPAFTVAPYKTNHIYCCPIQNQPHILLPHT
ncbi:hypothetical protein LOTGIDRAFT_105455, partial [Lottia gigantea]